MQFVEALRCICRSAELKSVGLEDRIIALHIQDRTHCQWISESMGSQLCNLCGLRGLDPNNLSPGGSKEQRTKSLFSFSNTLACSKHYCEDLVKTSNSSLFRKSVSTSRLSLPVDALPFSKLYSKGNSTTPCCLYRIEQPRVTP